MGVGKEGVVTTQGVVACGPRPVAALMLGLAVAGRPWPLGALVLGLAVPSRPRPLSALVLRLAVAGRPQPLPTLVLGLAIACKPWVGVLTGAALVLGVAVAADSVSCPLFAWPSAAKPPPSPTTLFRTYQTWL